MLIYTLFLQITSPSSNAVRTPDVSTTTMMTPRGSTLTQKPTTSNLTTAGVATHAGKMSTTATLFTSTKVTSDSTTKPTKISTSPILSTKSSTSSTLSTKNSTLPIASTVGVTTHTTQSRTTLISHNAIVGRISTEVTHFPPKKSTGGKMKTKTIVKKLSTSSVSLTTEQTKTFTSNDGNTLGLTVENITKRPKKSTSPAIIVVGVLVPIIIATIIGIIVYKLYRRKYPVRMVIGKNFAKFENPRYIKKTSTITLVRSDVSFDEKGTMDNDGHDNPSLDVDYMELQPAQLRINTEDSNSLTEIDEIPVKMPRRKKRVSVMSTESVDVKVMSAFLQEALDEVDSDGEAIEKDNKKKRISVDERLRKNMSVSSIDSENVSQTEKDETQHNNEKETNDSHRNSVYENTDFARSQDEHVNENKEEIDTEEYYTEMQANIEVTSGELYEDMDTTKDKAGISDEERADDNGREGTDNSDEEDADEYDIVNVNPEDEHESAQTFHAEIMGMPSGNIDNSVILTKNVNLRTEFVDISKNNGDMNKEEGNIRYEEEIYKNNQPGSITGTEGLAVSAVISNERLNENDDNLNIKVAYNSDENDETETDEESSGSVGSYSFGDDKGSLSNSLHRDSSSFNSDDSSTKGYEINQTKINDNSDNDLEQEPINAWEMGFKNDTSLNESNIADLNSFKEIDTSPDDGEVIQILPSTQGQQLDNKGSESDVINSENILSSEDEFLILSTNDYSGNNSSNTASTESFEMFKTQLIPKERAELDEHMVDIQEESGQQISDELPSYDNYLKILSNNKTIDEFTKDDNKTNEKNKIFYMPQESDEGSNSVDEISSTPPLPSTTPPIFDIYEPKSLTANSVPKQRVGFDIDLNSDHDVIVSESPPTPPLPTSLPPNYENVMPHLSSDSFILTTSTPTSNEENIHSNMDGTIQTLPVTYDSESSNDYDLVLNEDDLLHVSSDGDDADTVYLPANNNAFNSTNQAQRTGNLSKIEPVHQDESDLGQFISSLSDDSDSDEKMTQETVKFSNPTPDTKRQKKTVETSTKLVVIPKIDFEDSGSNDGTDSLSEEEA